MRNDLVESGSDFGIAHLPWFGAGSPNARRTLRAQLRNLKPYLLAMGCVALSTLVALLLDPFSSLEDEAMIYLLGDILAACASTRRSPSSRPSAVWWHATSCSCNRV
jgi:hypothetical protein